MQRAKRQQSYPLKELQPLSVVLPAVHGICHGPASEEAKHLVLTGQIPGLFWLPWSREKYEGNSKINLRWVGKKKRVVIAAKRMLSSNK
jgi:hypothetical protein